MSFSSVSSSADMAGKLSFFPLGAWWLCSRQDVEVMPGVALLSRVIRIFFLFREKKNKHFWSAIIAGKLV